MKKAQLVDALTDRQNLPRQQVETLVDDLIEVISETLASGDRVDIRGFGAFVVKESAARTGRNPQTGEPIEIAARKVPAFRVGKELKDRVNQA